MVKTTRPKPKRDVPLPDPLPDAPIVEGHPLQEEAKKMAELGSTTL